MTGARHRPTSERASPEGIARITRTEPRHYPSSSEDATRQVVYIAICSPRHRATTRRAPPDTNQGHSPTGGVHLPSDPPASPVVYPGTTRGQPRHDPSSDRASPELSAASRLGAAGSRIRSTRCGVHHLLGKVWRVVGVSPRVAQGESTGSLGLVWRLLRVCRGVGRTQSASPLVLVHDPDGVSPQGAQGTSRASSEQSDDRSGSVCDPLGVGPVISEGMSTPSMDILRDLDHLCLEIRPGESRPCSV